MTKIEENAFRITELIGLPTNVSNRLVFEQFNGLMNIVFECNKCGFDVTIDINFNDVILTQYKSNHKIIYTYGIYEENEFIKTEQTFIQAIQQCCIKYLELKNNAEKANL